MSVAEALRLRATSRISVVLRCQSKHSSLIFLNAHQLKNKAVEGGLVGCLVNSNVTLLYGVNVGLAYAVDDLVSID